MRTSATGRPDRRRAGQAGFTLVELLMAVTIIGLAAGAVVLAMPDPRPAVGAEAERFAGRLSRAREEAVLSNRPVAVEATAAGYGFLSFDGARWSPLNEGPFKAEVWQAGTTISAADGAARAVFDPTGVADPFRLSLSRDNSVRTIVVDGAGEVSVHG